MSEHIEEVAKRPYGGMEYKRAFVALVIAGIAYYYAIPWYIALLVFLVLSSLSNVCEHLMVIIIRLQHINNILNNFYDLREGKDRIQDHKSEAK